MQPYDPNRREFTKWAAAAVGGLAAGLGAARLAGAAVLEPAKKDVDKPLMAQEPHVCRGLNTCKGKSAGAKNECAGQGDCATAKAHTCAGDNDCAGLGGCNAKVNTPGENKCKGMGGCAVPMKDAKIWSKARASFEADMKKAFPDKKIGDAPKAP
ncbi:MAG TPA: hypothetical protein VMS17_21695 [Gemmataceae bacterium]|nr:hypothetical protein [Gemmataceae bacterium]